MQTDHKDPATIQTNRNMMAHPSQGGAHPLSAGPTNPQPYQDAYSGFTEYVLSINRPQYPSANEMYLKEQLRSLIDVEIVQRIQPSRVIPFGSLVNGFATANSDLDLCILDDSPNPRYKIKTELPEVLAAEFERYGFEVKLLTKTRIPIIKLVQGPTAQFPLGLAMDIGFENRLALHNTRLLATYSRIDSRLREMVLFVKHWAKVRGINSSYHGTLSSYGYVLTILHFLINVASPSCLPNLQHIGAQVPVPFEELECEGYNIWFFKDLTNIPPSLNRRSIGELMAEYFSYYAQFDFRNMVISIRTPGGLLTKTSKGWTQALDRVGPEDQKVRSRNFLCIEDPFEITHNVGRTVGKNGLYDIRGEYMRASKLTRARDPRVFRALCEQR
ncbi:hypothetical protein G7K_0361-t1 [Saitoella complicata NRRL Y-17804]|uniref:polynucleotide adenylyltransferase n=1 Tax=Saitoella complicata (strain BCRC 22490 / CBS 7301 / JCM 7358 / NBRC 10748 / NRRL Y-17804) TaxID=698492 RepID=A0A0E9N886_SAICN|nr:hypothetical protein G7K_0361-t1 [Saitoella complicata NRRL Y-17804]